MKCCDENRTTPYCPECGAQLIKDSIGEVRSFISGKLKSAESVHKRSKEWDDAHPDSAVENWRLRKREAHQWKIDKYKRWVKELSKYCLADKNK